MEGSLNKNGLVSFDHLLNQFQNNTRNGIARANIPTAKSAEFNQHFTHFSQVMFELNFLFYYF